MKIILTVWGIAIVLCILEAYFCTKFDPESRKFLKNRENEKRNNNLHK